MFSGTMKNARGVPADMTNKKSELAKSLRRGEFFMLHAGINPCQHG